MGNFFSSLFSSSAKEETDGMSKSDRKKFDILKYDGVRAQKIGKSAYAIKCFTEALAIDEDLETMSYLVGAYTMTHELEKAWDVLNRMVEIDPNRLNTLFTRVNVLFLLNREQEVIAECQRILALDTANYLAYYFQARAKRTLGDLDGALADVDQAIALNGECSDAFLLRSGIYLQKADGEAALRDVSQVLSVEGEEETAYLLRGNIHVFMKDVAAAEEDFNKVLELNPFHEEASLRLADLLRDNERYSEAIAVLDDLIDLAPTHPKAYLERGKIKNLTGDSEGAALDLAKAGELQEAEVEAGGQADFSNLYQGGIF